MKNLISILVLSVVAFANSGCKYEDEPYVITCADGPIAWEEAPSFLFELRNVGEDRTKEVNLFINNDTEYVKYIQAVREYPKIDFKRKTMIIVRVFNNFSYSTTGRHLTIDCKMKVLRWVSDASKVLTGPAIVEPQIFLVLVPKLDEKTSFIFDTNIVK